MTFFSSSQVKSDSPPYSPSLTEWLLRTARPPTTRSKRWTSTTGLAAPGADSVPRQVLPTSGRSGASRGSGSPATPVAAASAHTTSREQVFFIGAPFDDVDAFVVLIPEPVAVFRRVTMPGSLG